MRSNLKRIEQALHRLEQPQTTAVLENSDALASPPLSRDTSLRPVSFEVKPKPPAKPQAKSQAVPSSIAVPESIVPQAEPKPEPSEPSSPSAESEPRVAPFPIELEPEPKTLQLPKLKSTVQFSRHRHGANPALSASLLREMLGVVEGWQTELADIGRQIQDLYIAGPIVDGWLESNGEVPHAETVAFKHAEISQLIQFVEKLQSGEIQPERVLINGAGYRLCGINADGRVWSCPCPAEQVPTVSLAIARHHKLRQLTQRQQELETRLGQLSEDLVMLHSQLKA